MQDDITVPPDKQLKWLIFMTLVSRNLLENGTRRPMIITNKEAMYYRLHSWFWNVGSQRAGNDNES